MVEILIVVAILGLLAIIALPKFSDYKQRANRTSIVADCRHLYTSFIIYYQDHRSFPDTASFNLNDFEPLRSGGHYNGKLHAKLLNNQGDSYNSPNPDEFWLLLTQRDNVLNQFLIIKSDESPLAPGKSMNGIFWIYNGTLQNQL